MIPDDVLERLRWQCRDEYHLAEIMWKLQIRENYEARKRVEQRLGVWREGEEMAARRYDHPITQRVISWIDFNIPKSEEPMSMSEKERAVVEAARRVVKEARHYELSMLVHRDAFSPLRQAVRALDVPRFEVRPWPHLGPGSPKAATLVRYVGNDGGADIATVAWCFVAHLNLIARLLNEHVARGGQVPE